jgi:hypothetical protein
MFGEAGCGVCYLSANAAWWEVAVLAVLAVSRGRRGRSMAGGAIVQVDAYGCRKRESGGRGYIQSGVVKGAWTVNGGRQRKPNSVCFQSWFVVVGCWARLRVR